MSAPDIRYIIGVSTGNGFTSFSDGDLFQKDREVFRLHCGSHGWTLRRTIKADGYRTDWQAPPLEGWVEIESAMGLVELLNKAASEN